MELSDLVVLIYASNTCYATVVKVDDVPKSEDDGFGLDLKNEIWSYRGQILKIGEDTYHRPDCRGGVIGVYDRTNIEHLSSMVHHSINATSRPVHTF